METFILQFDYKITLTSYQASAGRDDESYESYDIKILTGFLRNLI